jgi:hypothetical protein
MKSCEAIWAKAFVKSRSLIYAVVRCNNTFLIPTEGRNMKSGQFFRIPIPLTFVAVERDRNGRFECIFGL